VGEIFGTSPWQFLMMFLDKQHQAILFLKGDLLHFSCGFGRQFAPPPKKNPVFFGSGLGLS
jgi:hypothetical protein